MSRPLFARPVWSALARVWDHLLGQPAAFTSPPPPPASLPAKLTLLPLEERVVPDGRPLPVPMLFAGAGSGAPPRVRAYLAETGELAFEKQPFESEFAGGVRVAAGDVNHDGMPDLIAAAGPGGGPRVVVYDGRTGDPISGPLASFYAYDESFSGGVWVASGDVDGDGHADVITGAGAGGGPHVKVFSGATGDVIASFYAYSPEFLGGATIASADFTGDGKADVVTGAGAGGAPHVRVFDLNATGGPAEVLGFYAYDTSFTGGVEVGSDFLAGDVTGDGVADIVTGAGAGGGPHVKVFDGVSGKQVRSFMAFDTSFSGGVRVSTAFVDDDDQADVIAGMGDGGGQVKVFSGVDSSELDSPMSPYSPFGGSYTGGVYVAGSNDPDFVSVNLSFPSSAVTGDSITMTATVSDANPFNGTQMPTGTVTFTTSSGAVTFGTATLSPTGTAGQALATLIVNPLTLAAGTFTISGDYGGDSWFSTGTTKSLSAMTVSAPSTPSPPAFMYSPPNSLCGCNCPTVAGSAGAGTTGSQAKAGGIRYDGAFGVALFGGVAGAVNSSADFSPYGGGVQFTNASGYTDSLVKAGLGVTIEGQPRLTPYASGSKMALVDGCFAQSFDVSGGSYTTPFGSPATLLANGGTSELELTDGQGATLYFYDFGGGTPSGRAGRLKRRVDAAGNSADVVSWDGSGRPTELQITDPTGAVESLVWAYDGSGYVTSVTRRSKPSGGSFSTERVVEYGYATLGSDKVLETTTEKDGSGNVLGETFERYYTTTGGTGYSGGLKYHLGAQAVARVKAAFPSTALTSLTDGQIDDYADVAVQYNPSNQRATQVVRAGEGCSACAGGFGTSAVYYSVKSSPGSGVNDWVGKVAVTLDDGSTQVSYANKWGQELLSVVTEPSTGKVWMSYTKYDSAGRVVLQASPSAVTGYSESLSDLVGWSGSSATHLRSGDGFISTVTYASSTTATTSTAGDVSGYVKSTAIQRGTGGTAIPQSEMTYIARTANSQTRYHVASTTQYRNDNGTGGQTTSYAYTWQGSTAQIASVTTTLPTVTTAQNGPNSAATSVVVYDAVGRPIWMKDAAGVLSYTAYEAQTGAVTKTIQDVNTANTSDFANLPSGWSTPSGAGQHLISQYEVDALGRTTKFTDPLGQITYTVYDDINKAVRVYAGWTGSATTGPTVVQRDDWAGGYTETLTMSATPTTSGSRPTGAESVSSIQSLSRSYRNTAGQRTHTDSYFDLTGVTYSTAANIGTLNTNYYRTEQGYDKQGRANKTVSAAGTITRTEYDAMGRVASTWVGTDDTPTSGFWSVTNTAGTNMVKVSETEYDNGGVGDSLATKQTLYPGGGAAARVTQTWYDWRDRAVGVKSGVETSESTSVNRPLGYVEYDNLGTAVVSESYDGDTVSLTDGNSDGIPDRPSSSLLRAKSVTSTDEWGRVYKSETFSVDPSSGSVSTYALTSQTWFDIRGLTLKTSAPGGLVQKYAYDSLGRAITVYVSDGGGDSGWSDADDVTGDTVLSQSETTYDADGNVLLSVGRERMHTSSGTGALGSVGSGIGARVSYSAAYYDLANRVTDTVNVGTNGGSSWSRPGSVPSRSDTVLVQSTVYDAAGRVWKVTDPRGLESRTTYDLMGRTVKTIENYVDGTVSDADDKTTEYTYSAAGMTSLTAKLTGGGGQTTEWVYGVTQSGGSGLDSNDLVGATKWPDPSSGSASSGQQETVLVNALGQPLVTTDRNGSVHTLTYDILGRVVSDAVTTLGSGVDGSVRRVETAYDTQGNAYLFTNYDAASSGSIVTQTQRAFNGLGQLTTEWQSRGAAVNTSTSPKVQYAYSTLDANNRSRLTSVTYPSGYVLTYNYASGINSDVSRLSSLSDTSGTLESYDYLGLGTVVKRAHPQSGVDQTFILQVPEATGDAGDQYIGLDRFGRVADQRWRGSGVDVDRHQYAYDRDGNRVTKTNTVNSAYSEAYTYDGLNQLSTFNRNSGARTQSWDYDALGNWDSLTTNGGSPQTRTHNKQNEITTVSGATTPTFDANGNMTTDETGQQYVYDAWNRLKVVKNSGGTTLKTYAYDALNRRVAETASGTTTDLYYSVQWQVLEEAVSGTTKARYVWSPVYVDAMILRDRDADANSGNGLEERLWVMQDANWNVTGLVNGSGTVVERYAYDPFGSVTYLNGSWSGVGNSAYGWQYLHQGTLRDSTSVLDDHRARWYSPSLGRWASLDPIRFNAGDVDLYRALANNPDRNVDPSGLIHPVILVGGAIVIGYFLYCGVTDAVNHGLRTPYPARHPNDPIPPGVTSTVYTQQSWAWGWAPLPHRMTYVQWSDGYVTTYSYGNKDWQCNERMDVKQAGSCMMPWTERPCLTGEDLRKSYPKYSMRDGQPGFIIGGICTCCNPAKPFNNNCQTEAQGLVDFVTWDKYYNHQMHLSQEELRLLNEETMAVIAGSTAPGGCIGDPHIALSLFAPRPGGPALKARLPGEGVIQCGTVDAPVIPFPIPDPTFGLIKPRDPREHLLGPGLIPGINK